MNVGVAEPTRLDAHEQLSGGGLRDGQILDLQRAIEAADDGGLHGYLLSRGCGASQRTRRAPSVGGRPSLRETADGNAAAGRQHPGMTAVIELDRLTKRYG